VKACSRYFCLYLFVFFHRLSFFEIFLSPEMANFVADTARDQLLERPLPNSAEAERAILGSVILDNGLVSQAIELLKPDDFYVPSHRRIFLAMISLFERGSEINPILVGEELRREG
jgi:replicative DNA helicase